MRWRSAASAQGKDGGLSRRPLLLGLGASLALMPSGLRAAAPDRLTFPELYAQVGVLGLKFSDRLQALAGKRVVMRGFMAPPLKPESNFFVLTREPMALCPFCQSDADWPSDIVVVLLTRAAPVTDPSDAIEVEGKLEVGRAADPETGFVSQIRLSGAAFREV